MYGQRHRRVSSNLLGRVLSRHRDPVAACFFAVKCTRGGDDTGGAVDREQTLRERLFGVQGVRELGVEATVRVAGAHCCYVLAAVCVD